VLAPLLLTTVVCCIWSVVGFDMVAAGCIMITVCLTAEPSVASETTPDRSFASSCSHDSTESLLDGAYSNLQTHSTRNTNT
jgi:hypothetical protein